MTDFAGITTSKYFCVYRNYIKKLIQHELKQTDEDIDEITAKLQTNIEEKQRQVQNLRALGLTAVAKNKISTKSSQCSIYY